MCKVYFKACIWLGITFNLVSEEGCTHLRVFSKPKYNTVHIWDNWCLSSLFILIYIYMYISKVRISKLIKK